MVSTPKPLGNCLRLEIQDDPAAGALSNMVRNPNGSMGGWGWQTPVAGSTISGVTTGAGAPWLVYASAAGVPNYFYSEPMAVAAGQYVAASWVTDGSTTKGWYRARLEWLDSSKNVLSQSAQTAYSQTSGALGPYQAPASTTYVRLRFDHYADTAGGNPTAGTGLTFKNVTVAKAATSAALGTTRTNLTPNPSFEAGIAGWAEDGTYDGSVSQGSAGAVGSKSLQLNGPGYVAAIAAASIAVTPGATYTLSVYGRVSSLYGARSDVVNLDVRFNGDSTNRQRLTWNRTELTAGTWLRKSLIFTVPTDATFLTLRAYTGDDMAAGDYAQLDGFLLELGTSVGSYFDGDTTDTASVAYDWVNRTPVASTRTNLATNPSFEAATTGWTVYGTGATYDRVTSGGQQGAAAARLTAAPVTVTNLVSNPNFETSTAGWGIGAGAADIARVAVSGYNRCRLRATSGVTTLRAYMNQSAAMAVTAGQSVQLGLDFMIPTIANATPSSLKGGILYRWYNSGGTQIGSDGLLQQAASLNTWYSPAWNVTAPAGATQLRIYPHVDYVIGTAVDVFQVTIYFDLIYAVTPAVTGYFDGSSADTSTYRYDWLSTANLSASTRKTVTADGGISTTITGVTPGASYAASAWFKTAANARSAFIEFAWKDSGGAALSTVRGTAGTDSTTWQRFSNTAVAPAGAASVVITLGYTSLGFDDVHYIDGVLVEKSATVGDYFDGSTPDVTVDFTVIDRAWTGAADASTSTETSTMTLPYSTATSNTLAYIEPVPWRNILGPAHDIKITRRALDVGTLVATIVDSTLDPSQSALIRPGRLIRLTALNSVGVWDRVFSGQVARAEVSYELTDPEERKRARIELTAVDNIQVLSNQQEKRGVATIAELPLILEGKGCPWNVNGSGNQVATGAVVATNSNASTVDQIAVTRDTVSGFAWVDRFGTLQAWDRSKLSTARRGSVLDEAAYRDIVVAYNTESLINEVNVSLLLPPADADSDSDTSTYGPYRNEASIAQWGVRSSTFTVEGLVDEAAVAAYANAVLAANSTPVVRMNSMDLTVDLSDDWSAVAAASWFAYADLYDMVEAVCARAAIANPQRSRITGIEHSISGPDSKWLVTLDFTSDTVVASPTFVPSPSVSTDTQSITTLLRPIGEVTMWYGAKADIPAGWLALDGGTVPAEFTALIALLGGTTLPDFTDRMPIGAGTKALNTVGGSPTAAIAAGNLPSHTHTTPNHTHTTSADAHAHTIGSGTVEGTTANINRSSGGSAGAITTSSDSHSHTIASSGGGTSGAAYTASPTPISTISPWRALWFIIRAR